MRWLRRLGITILVLAILALTGWLTMPYWVPILAKRFEPYIRSELTAILDEYLVPTVTIEHIEYEWPLKVVATGVKLTATPPSKGPPMEILDLDRLVIELDRIPRSGEPLVFRDFTLDGPSLVFHATKDGDLVGWGNLLKDTGTQSDNRKASEIFAIDVITVSDFSVEYSMEGIEDKMVLDELDFKLDNQGKQEEDAVDLPQGPGWYAIDTTLQRKGLFSAELVAGIDIDTLDADVEKLKLKMAIDETSRSFLPPQFQQIMVEHDIASHIDATVRAKFNAGDMAKSDAAAHLELGESHFAIRNRIIEIASATADFIYTDSELFTDNATIAMLGGTVGAKLHIRPANPADLVQSQDTRPSPPPATPRKQNDATRFVPEATMAKVTEVASGFEIKTEIQLEDLKIQDLHRVRETGKQEEGIMNGKVELQANLGNPLPSLTGSGQVKIADGRFEMSAIFKALAGIMKVVSLDFNGKDSIEADFTIAKERVNITSCKALVGPIGARARGWIAFDSSLELKFNAGPLERFQESTGVIGRAFGAVTDSLLNYVATGTLSDPKVHIAPLGIDFGMLPGSGTPNHRHLDDVVATAMRRSG
ncbi:MAG: hypothetical protein MK085_10525 [Phycisphaerales bacterium]|nr:hypothetical protein [Phycisphaerales bacterium]